MEDVLLHVARPRAVPSQGRARIPTQPDVGQSAQCYQVSYDNTRHYTTIHDKPRQYTTPNHIIRNYTTIYNTVRHYTTPYHNTRHYTTLHDTVRHTNIPHHGTLFFTILWDPYIELMNRLQDTPRPGHEGDGLYEEATRIQIADCGSSGVFVPD